MNSFVGKAIYKTARGLAWLIFPRIRVEGLDNMPGEPCIVVGNHSQMYGPIFGEIDFPGPRRIWCASEMMNMKEVSAYAFADFWDGKPKGVRWLYKILSHLIPPISVGVFTNALTIPVYRDARIVSTFRETMNRLSEGDNIIIYPEHAQPHNAILCDFQAQFIDVAYFYRRQTGKELCFVPMYIAPKLKRAYLGKPVRFDGGAPIALERERIKACLMDEITAMARALPEHRVVPYVNVSKKKYPSSRD